MHDICNLFGVALNRARHELGLTQVELAEKLGTTDRSISLRARKDQSKAGYGRTFFTLFRNSHRCSGWDRAERRCPILRQDVLCRDEHRGSG